MMLIVSIYSDREDQWLVDLLVERFETFREVDITWITVRYFQTYCALLRDSRPHDVPM